MKNAPLTARSYLVTSLLWLGVWLVVSAAAVALGSENIWKWADDARFWDVIDKRLYGVLVASAVGGCLALAGLALQALLRNPLADPFVLGVSGGASLAVILASLWVSVLAAPLFGFVGAMVTIVAIYAVAQRRGRLEPYTLLLVGVIANAFYGAAIMLIASMVAMDTRGEIAFYMMGTINSFDPQWTLAVVVAGLAVAAAAGLAVLAKGFNLVAVGEDTAGAMGVRVDRLRLVTFAMASLVTGASVALAGPIGFVGLICPHLLRLAMGPDYRRLVPAALFFGATFLVAADLAVRLLQAATGKVTPVGVLTAMAGVPFFIYLLRARWHRTAEIH
jgi:iron complex transport system permease protein